MTHRPDTLPARIRGITSSLAEGEARGLWRRSSGPALPLQATGTILWIHGLGESGYCFEAMLRHPRLATWRQFAFDLPGYGKSAFLPKPLGLAEQADRLLRVLDSLDLNEESVPLVVVGHSMGGVIGTLLAEQRADAIAGFVNVEGNLSVGDCGFSSRAAAVSLDDFVAEGFERLVQDLLEEAADEPALAVYRPSVCLCDPRAFHMNSRELVELSKAEKLVERLGRLAPPTLYLYGAPRGLAARSLELLDAAGIEPVRITPAGHWPFLDCPEPFLDALLVFLSRIAAG